MQLFSFSVILFVIGLFIGSFLNVVIDRLPRKETIFKGRSHCEFCKHTLSWIDLIPVLSYVSLGGKCRYCKKFIGYRYPFIEIITGVIFSLASIYLYQHNQTVLWLSFYIFVSSCLIIIFFIDLFNRIIPDSILLPLGIFSIIFNFFTRIENIFSFILSGVFAFMFFLFLVIITKGKGMGFGDVKFVLVMGLLLGFPGIVTSIYIAFLIGAVFSVVLIILHKKKMKSTIAFGPFLAIGTFCTLIWGNLLLNAALNFLK